MEDPPKSLETTSDVLLHMAQCMARAWKAPGLLAAAEAQVQAEEPDAVQCRLKTPYMELKVTRIVDREPRQDPATSTWTTLKLRFYDPRETEGLFLAEFKWVLLSDDSLAQLYYSFHDARRVHQFRPYLTWQDVEKDLAEMWPRAEQTWKGFAMAEPNKGKCSED